MKGPPNFVLGTDVVLHWRQTMDFVLSWQVYHLAFKLELFNILYVREFNDINCKDGKVLHIYLVSVRVY